mmetsp:Transcript_72916/g.142715  ORF Transcript_72916/g.142715 Transcript_72916/m.142715 type:complete len:82 (+) Transcript_72916:682-927(+)
MVSKLKDVLLAMLSPTPTTATTTGNPKAAASAAVALRGGGEGTGSAAVGGRESLGVRERDEAKLHPVGEAAVLKQWNHRLF